MPKEQKRMDSKFQKRIQRHLYYGNMSDMEKPSFPLTELAVDYFHDSVPDKLGHVDMYTAADVIRKSKVSPASMVLSMLYAKRLRQTNQDYLNSISSSDIFFISMMMASKYLYDEGVEEEVFNDEWADNTDQDVDYVNQMEMNFLKAIDWRLFVSPDDFDNTLAAIERRLALQEGLKRKWFTYSELDVLLTSDLMSSLWHQTALECSKVVSTISAVYLTGIFTLLGSTALAVQVSGPLTAATLAIFSLSAQPLPVSNILINFWPLQSSALQKASFGFTDVNEALRTSVDVENQSEAQLFNQPLGESPATSDRSFDYDAANTKVPAKQPSLIWSLWVFDSLLTHVLALTRYKTELLKKPFSSTLDQEKFAANDLNDSAPHTVTRNCHRYTNSKLQHRCSRKSQRHFTPSESTKSQETNEVCPQSPIMCFSQDRLNNLDTFNSKPCPDHVTNEKADGSSHSSMCHSKITNERLNRFQSTTHSEHVELNCDDHLKPLRDMLMTSWFHPAKLNPDLLTHSFSFHPGLNQGIKVT